MRLFLRSVVVLGFLVAGCASEAVGSGSEDDPKSGGAERTGGSGDAPCKVTLSGARAGEYACSVFAGFDAAANQSTIGVVKLGDAVPMGSFGVTVAGEAKAGTVTYASAVEGGFSWKTEATAVPPTWAALKDKDPSYNRGDFTLVIASIAVSGPMEDGKVYAVHGTMKGTMPALDDTGASGTITVSITF